MASFENTEALKFKKVCDDVVTSLEMLQGSLQKEEEYRPQQTINTAVGALQQFQKMAEIAEIPAEQTGRLLDLVRNPAILTAFGSQQVELAGLLNSVQTLLEKIDPKKVRGPGFDPLGQGR